MHSNHDSVGSLGAEDQLISLRRQINEIKEHIDLLMLQSAIIRERRCLFQHQQDITPLVITEQLDSTSAEISSVDILDIKPETSQDSTVSGPSLALKGAADFPASRPRSKSIVKTIPPDNTVALQLPTQSQRSTSKLGAIPRRSKPGRREFQGRSARHEPPALFQGWADALC
ncbi:hypothetical protein DFJ58DRAFT_798178 [Suillus subalutaceus]|uniref:uncharacterized protein n=1 Tax=Suillus subalutaceus TaxID=48586 RepID=UPI001B87D189|nr:uncharacterized protein DFJ58DRAFT_798178 [Suillus subalutaceus]KAG1847149.1 hypothetical protein DFJ58DRAFT_798178 [Suillus subalutaceus]